MTPPRVVPLLVLLSVLIGCLPLSGGRMFAQSTAPSETLDIPDQIVVATRDVPPFAMQNEDGGWEGISIDLMRSIKSDLEAESKHQIQLRFESHPLDEMLDAVAAGQIDVAVAAITVNAERERRMDFTHPFYHSGLGIAVGAAQRRSGWSGIIDAILSPTFLRILSGLAAAMLVSAVAVYFFERKYHGGDFEYGILPGIGAGLWWAAVTLTTVGYGDKVPRTLPGRLIGLIWMFSGLFIIASFTAAVTSALTVNQLRSRVAGPADLSRVKVATVAGSTSAGYLRSRHIRFQSYESVELALQCLTEGRCDAVVYDAPILRHLVFQAEAGDLFVLPVTFERQSYAFALPSGSPLREPINQSLLHWTSSSSWEDTLQSYLGDDVE